VVKEGTEEVSEIELRSYLRERLPEYMVPATLMLIEEMPLSGNGKVDRKRLPAPDRSRPQLLRPYLAPRSDVELQIASICQELLGLERVGIDDNFFELGGHSLMAMQLIARVRAHYGAEIGLAGLFREPTIRRLAEAVEEGILKSSDPDEVEEMLKMLEEIGDDQALELMMQESEQEQQGLQGQEHAEDTTQANQSVSQP
jgi:acyl carrier protein